MLKLIFTFQAAIYLLLMPTLRSWSEMGYRPPIILGILVLAALLSGFSVFNIYRIAPTANASVQIRPKLRPKSYLPYAIASLIVLYSLTVVAFGLFNRRQGSEYMAELYADLPIYALAILRGYEILLIPIALLYAFGHTNSVAERRIILSLLVASLPFTGAVDSRSRILLMAMFILCFVPYSVFISSIKKNIRVYLAAFAAIGSFLFYSAQRASSYASSKDYLFFEVYSRLDGLNLVTDLREGNIINWVGTFDLTMFSPLISKLPFLDAAHEAKLSGRTSTKQYLLQDVLGRTNLDAPNSMIADPIYFAGVLGIVMCFGLLGYAIARSDNFVKMDRFMVDRHRTIVSMAFVMSFAVFENDFLGSVVSFVQNYLILALFIGFGTTTALPASIAPIRSKEEGTKAPNIAIPQGFQ